MYVVHILYANNEHNLIKSQCNSTLQTLRRLGEEGMAILGSSEAGSRSCEGTSAGG
jgi:hypothetical protein